MKKILINIVCAFIPNRQTRKRIRFLLNNHKEVKLSKDFAIKLSKTKHPKIRYLFGFRCANLVLSIDDKIILKFPTPGTDGKENATREKRITDALRPISPIKIPNMEIINWNGIYVRKYEQIKGINFNKLSRTVQNEHALTIAKQLAKFLYIIGTADPIEIQDLKNKKSAKPSIMHGWNQNDLWDNFIMDPKTFDIKAIIDWEGVKFDDFYTTFTGGTGNKMIKSALLKEYLKEFINNKL